MKKFPEEKWGQHNLFNKVNHCLIKIFLAIVFVVLPSTPGFSEEYPPPFEPKTESDKKLWAFLENFVLQKEIQDGGPEVMRKLIPGINHVDVSARYYSAISLVHLIVKGRQREMLNESPLVNFDDYPEVYQGLRNLLNDEFAETRSQALVALQMAYPISMEIIDILLDRWPKEDSLSVKLQVLGYFQLAPFIPRETNELLFRSMYVPSLKSWALMAIKKHLPEGGLPFLLRRLKKETSQIKFTNIIQSIIAYGPRARPHLDELKSLQRNVQKGKMEYDGDRELVMGSLRYAISDIEGGFPLVLERFSKKDPNDPGRFSYFEKFLVYEKEAKVVIPELKKNLKNIEKILGPNIEEKQISGLKKYYQFVIEKIEGGLPKLIQKLNEISAPREIQKYLMHIYQYGAMDVSYLPELKEALKKKKKRVEAGKPHVGYQIVLKNFKSMIDILEKG